MNGDFNIWLGQVVSIFILYMWIRKNSVFRNKCKKYFHWVKLIFSVFCRNWDILSFYILISNKTILKFCEFLLMEIQFLSWVFIYMEIFNLYTEFSVMELLNFCTFFHIYENTPSLQFSFMKSRWKKTL